ncbi:hypothetical protein, partial [Poseidonocella sp. HB161398]|uniref:hypothetical protein n=1 Tax=Poseidonocella sp. HB161398 TaxID=2320855 RepID=UPI001107FD0D
MLTGLRPAGLALRPVPLLSALGPALRGLLAVMLPARPALLRLAALLALLAFLRRGASLLSLGAGLFLLLCVRHRGEGEEEGRRGGGQEGEAADHAMSFACLAMLRSLWSQRRAVAAPSHLFARTSR